MLIYAGENVGKRRDLCCVIGSVFGLRKRLDFLWVLGLSSRSFGEIEVMVVLSCPVVILVPFCEDVLVEGGVGVMKTVGKTQEPVGMGKVGFVRPGLWASWSPILVKRRNQERDIFICTFLGFLRKWI